MRLLVVSVLYEADTRSAARLVHAVEIAAARVVENDRVSAVTLMLGDCGSPELAVDALRNLCHDSSIDVRYQDFVQNLGHSAGCNALVASVPDLAEADSLVFLNPDALPEERALGHLINVLARAEVGVVDARQLPMEHPKVFDPVTFEQSWASGACLGIRHGLFEQVGGFDSMNFWSYCNDVDLSWRTRLTGHTAVHVPEAVVFHDKRLDVRGRMVATPSQDYYSALGRLNLASRYGRPDIVSKTARWLQSHGTAQHRAALAEFRHRATEQRVPSPLAGASAIAQFVGGDYAPHRF